MATSATLKDFTGIDNQNADSPKGGGLSAAFNVDLTDAKTLKSMPGRRLVYQGSCRSAHADAGYIYFCEAATVKRMAVSTRATETLYSSLASTEPMAWLSLNGAVYASNGTDNLVFDGGIPRTWGIVPPAVPVVATEYGELPAGKYLVALTYIRSTGLESGSSVPVVVDSTGGGISITGISTSSDALVSYVGIYASPRNSKTLYFVGHVANGTVSALYRGPIPGNLRPLQTEGMINPPGGSLLEFFHGRVYMFNGATLWHTELGKYEHVAAKKGFIQFPENGTMLKALESGIWVSTTKEVIFLAGQDPTSQGGLAVRARTGSPAIKGTAMVLDSEVLGVKGVQGQVVVWGTAKGYCIGTNDGFLYNLTGGRFHPPQSDIGSCAFLNDGTVRKYVTSFVVLDNELRADLPLVTMAAS